MFVHVAGDDMPSDEGTESPRRVVAEVAGKGGLINQSSDNFFILGEDHIFLDKVLPHLLFVFAGPGIFVVVVANNILGLGIGEHHLGEEQFLALFNHVIQCGDRRFVGQVFIHHPFGKAVGSQEGAFAGFCNEFGHAGVGVVFEILAEVHIDANEEIVAVAKNGRDFEVHSGNQGVEFWDGCFWKVCQVYFKSVV